MRKFVAIAVATTLFVVPSSLAREQVDPEAAKIIVDMMNAENRRADSAPYYIASEGADIGGLTPVVLYQRVQTDLGYAYGMMRPDEIEAIINAKGYKVSDVYAETFARILYAAPDPLDDDAYGAEKVNKAFLKKRGNLFVELHQYRTLETHKDDTEIRESVAQTDHESMQELARGVSYIGDLDVLGSNAHHLQMNDVTFSETQEGATYEINKVDYYVDSVRLLPLGFRMTGKVLHPDGKTDPLLIQSVYKDFKKVAGSDLVIPFKTEMSLKMREFSAKEKADLAKAKKELDAAMAQLGSMPANVRGMVEGQLASQRAMIAGMAEGEPITTSSSVYKAEAAQSEEEAIQAYLKMTGVYQNPE